MRRLRGLAIAAGLSLVAAGCIRPGPPTAVAVSEGVPSLLVKFCDVERGIGTVIVSRVTSDEPEQWPIVWRAELEPGATPLDQLLLVAQTAGYAIETGNDWPMQPDIEYAVTDATDDKGFSFGAILSFRIAELSRTGRVAADEGDGQKRDTWLGARGSHCGE